MKRKWLVVPTSLMAFLGSGNSFAASDTTSANASTSGDKSVATAPSPANPKAPKKVQFRYRFGLSAESFQNDKEQAQTVGFGLEGDLRYHLLDNLEFKAEGRLVLQSGQAQSQFGDNVPTSGVYLTEALVTYKPLHVFSIAAGAIDQSYLRSPLLVSSRPFPGVDEKLAFGNSKQGVEFIAEQSIPTSISLSTEVSDRDPTPYFLTETLNFITTPLQDLKLEAYASHYHFSRLPSSVAIDSVGFGNSSTGDAGSQTTQFLYRFDGFLAGGQGTLRLRPHWKLITGAQFLDNTEAPTAAGEGFLSYVETAVQTSKSFSFAPRVEYFFNESDSSPAFYNSSEYGHNNRRGYAGQIEMNFLKAGFKVKGRYVDANLINANANQSRQQYFLISFETFYAKI
jgi:hypothetical protein